MDDNIIHPTSHRALHHNHTTSNHFADGHRTDQNEGEADQSRRPLDPSHYNPRSTYPSEAIPPWTLGITSPPPQYIPDRAGIDIFPTTHVPETHAGLGLPYVARGFGHQDMGQPTVFHPDQMVNDGPEDGPLDALEELEHYLILGMPHMGRSLLTPTSAPPDYAVFTAWPGPVQVSDHEDHCSLSSLSSTPEPSALDVAPTVAYGAGTVMVSSPPLLVPSNWCRVPQWRYTARTGDTSFLEFQGVNFSVNRIPGFNLKCARDGVFTGLENRDSPVLEDAKGPVSCRLWFLGYPINPRSVQIPVRDWTKKPAPIKKSKLAYEVAKRVDQYLGVLSTTPIDPSVDPRWAAGKGYMKLEKMYLVSVSWVSKGSVQPDIWVDTSGA